MSKLHQRKISRRFKESRQFCFCCTINIPLRQKCDLVIYVSECRAIITLYLLLSYTKLGECELLKFLNYVSEGTRANLVVGRM